MSVRIRCEVLKIIAINDGITSEGVANLLPDFEPKQVQKAIYQLLTQDRVFKDGKKARDGSNGRPRFIYVANEDWEPARTKINNTNKKGRKNHSESLKTDGTGSFHVIRFRDRKIRLLTKLLDKVSGTDKDLLIGILADFSRS